MENHAKTVFLIETKNQAHMSLNAMSALAILIRTMRQNRDGPAFDLAIIQSEHFRTVHSFLTHLSNVSRIIWPPAFSSKRCNCKNNHEPTRLCGSCVSRSRARVIQEALGLDGVEHVLKNRTLRDHLEHFDERLDDWQQNSVDGNIVQDNIGPKGAYDGVEDVGMMRQLDPATGEFFFRGMTYNLIELAKGAEDIINRADEAIAKLRTK